MIVTYKLDGLVDVETTIAIAEELKACSISVELVEKFNEEKSSYDDLHLEVNLSDLDVAQAFKVGGIVENVVSHHIDKMWKEKRSIEQVAYATMATAKDGSQFSIPFKLSDVEDIDV